MKRLALMIAVLAVAAPLNAATIDGAMIPSEGLPLLATQDTPTGFGNATGGGQDSAGGSELNQLFASNDGTTLKLGITGNLEGNFNKLFIFFDATLGGESTLASDNADGGFGEINNLAGLSFADGVAMDHGLRLEIGGGFHSVRFFDLVDNTAFDVLTGGGPGSLPFANAGSGGVVAGWDNSNVDGVDGSSAAGAATATTGLEFEIDMATAFGVTNRPVRVTAFVTSGDAGFISNQVLPGIGGGGNIGGGSGQTVGSVLVSVPEPASLGVALLALVSVAGMRSRATR